MTSSSMRGRLLASTLLAAAGSIGAIAVLSAPGAAVAQDYTSGNLTGRVVNEAGAPVAGAAVTVRSSQGVVRSTVTDEDGRYQIPALAAGGYVADVTAAGYGGVQARAISLAPGGSSFVFTLAQGEVSELVVTGVRQTQDFERTDTGLVLNVEELSERIPVGRSITNVALLAPGAIRPDPTIGSSSRRDQSTIVVSGTSAAETVYYINGLNVTDIRNLLGYADLPFDAIQSIDVKTGGYQAEFGRATGGVVNIVTKSGSNEWHGGVTLTYSPESLRTHAPQGFSGGGSAVSGATIYNTTASLETIDASIYLSGPLLKDRLFFFGLVNPRSTKEYFALVSQGLTGNNLYTGVQTYNKSTDPRWLAKLDFNLTDTQRLEASFFSDETETSQVFLNRDIRTGFTGQGPGYVQKAGGLNQIYKYTGAFTDWFTLSALYGKQVSDQQDVGPLLGIPRVRDRRGDTTVFLTPANTVVALQPMGKDTRETYRVDADFYVRNLLGDHHFRVGYDKEKLRSTDAHGYNGGYYMDVLYGDPSPDGSLGDQPYAVQTFLGSSGAYDAEQTAIYAQDSWDITPTLTLQLGVRLDRYDYRNRAGESYIELDDQWAPRLGFTWDPRGEGRDKVYGSFGRYYLPIATNTSIRAVSGEDFHQEYRSVTVNPDGSLVRDAQGVPILGDRLIPDDIFARPVAPMPDEIRAANIEPMYEEEFILGYEHEFAGGFLDGWRAGARYMHRNLASTIEDTDLGRGGVIDRYCARTGDINCLIGEGTAESPNSNYLFSGAYALLNPGSSAELMLDLQHGPGGANPTPVLLTAEDLRLPKAKRKYDAVELTFERPFDGRWSLQGSYVWAKSKGNYEGAVKSDVGQTDTSLTQDFDAYFLTDGAYGYLPNDRRHTFKLFGVYQVTEALRVGANFYAQSGRPYGCLGYHPDDPSPGGQPSAWYCPIDGESVQVPRGSRGRTGWVTNTDLNLTYDIIQDRDGFGSVSAAVDVFNLFNERSATRVVEQGETINIVGRPVTSYGRSRSFQAPRSVRFTLRYSF